MGTIERQDKIANKAYIYNGQEVVILGYCDNTGDNGDEVEIYLNNGKTLEWNISDLILKLERFRPITNTVVVLANERLNQVSSVNHTIIQTMRDTILSQIKAVKESPTPEVINQSKQIFQGVNTLTNLAKTELEYRKYIDNSDKMPTSK